MLIWARSRAEPSGGDSLRRSSRPCCSHLLSLASQQKQRTLHKGECQLQSEIIARHQILPRILFRLKRVILQARRAVGNLLHPLPRLHRQEFLPHVWCEIRRPLRPSEDPAELNLTLGKIQNLRVACKSLNRTVVPRGAVFSFWRAVGPLTSWRGCVAGREIREGCVIPNRGGGICQLSNSLYQAALASGCEIVERHRHSVALPGSDAERGLDATVAWNDIDLRFRPPADLQIECFLTSEELVLRMRSLAPPSQSPAAPRTRTPLRMAGHAKSCVTCGQDTCSRHSPHLKSSGAAPPVWIVDGAWPEFLALREAERGRILSPREGDWPSSQTAPLTAAFRSVRARMVRGQAPAVVRQTLLEGDALAARALGRKLSHLDDEVVVALSLAGALWEDGALAGRRYRVILDRAPLGLLHRLLDEAARREPESPTLADFRADPARVRAEEELLAGAQEIITPHHRLAQMFENSRLIPWDQPNLAPADRAPENLIVFPGPAVARSGSRAVREAARRLNLSVMILGKMLEDPSLWGGIILVRPGPWESRALAVVQPSVMETRPRTLLRAAALGVPVVSGQFCGLSPAAHRSVEFGDAVELAEALSALRSPAPAEVR